MPEKQPIHPGRFFALAVLSPLGLSVTEAARSLGVTRKTLSEFVNERSGMSPEMAVRVGEATGTDSALWLVLQMHYDLYHAHQNGVRAQSPFSMQPTVRERVLSQLATASETYR